MREDAFRAYLAPRLGGRAVVASCSSNARLVGRTLGIDLDRLDLAGDGIATVRSRLVGRGVAARKAADCGAAPRHYAGMNGGPPLAPDPPGADHVAPRTVPSRHPAVTSVSVGGLMRLYGDLLAELRDRRIVRTANGPVGDYAEYLFSRAFDWTLAGNSQTGFDASDPAGRRYQIKGRRLDTPRAARQLGGIRRLDEEAFDTLALVLFHADMTVARAALVPRLLVVERAHVISHTNSWRLMAPDRLWTLPDVVDATADLRSVPA